MPALTPLEFANKYRRLHTFMYPQELPEGVAPGYAPPTGWTSTPVEHYRLGRSNWWHMFWKQDIAPRLGKSLRLIVRNMHGHDQELELDPHQLARHFYPPFVGKGSPEQAQIAIQLTYRYRRVTTPLPDFLKADFIGLDCNGFVGNYIQRVVYGWGQSWTFFNNDKDPGPTTVMSGIVQTCCDKQITSTTQLNPQEIYIFVLCEADGMIIDPGKKHAYGHVMITNPKSLIPLPDGKCKIKVVEATGSGMRLRDIDYTIQSATPANFGTVFRVLRGPTDAGQGMPVRIARLKIA
jgi:hypothetical protein